MLRMIQLQLFACLGLALAAAADHAAGQGAETTSSIEAECRCTSNAIDQSVTQCRNPANIAIASRALPARGTAGSNFLVNYDQDNRTDYHDPKLESWHKKALDAAVAIIPADRIMNDPGSGKFRLDPQTVSNLQTAPLTNPDTGQLEPPNCCNERFCRQPSAATCSGVRVGKNRDIMLTAGHCFSPSNPVTGYNFVFGYKISFAGQKMWEPLELVVCRGKPEKIVKGLTWQLVPLDCPAGATLPKSPPLGGVSSSAVNESIFTAGYPQGLPVKLAPDARIRSLIESDGKTVGFRADLDLFNGSSGSGVYRKDSSGQPVLVGIVEEGFFDYQIVRRSGAACRRTCVINTVSLPADAGETITAITGEIRKAIEDMDR